MAQSTSDAAGPAPPPGRRPRLIAADLTRLPGSRARVHVALELDGREHVAERRGVGEEAMLLRLAAEATLEALGRATGRPDHFTLMGIKRIHAFDTGIVLASIRAADARVGRVLGCVPVEDALVRAAARSVLDATNRLVEAFGSDPPHPP